MSYLIPSLASLLGISRLKWFLLTIIVVVSLAFALVASWVTGIFTEDTSLSLVSGLVTFLSSLILLIRLINVYF